MLGLFVDLLSNRKKLKGVTLSARRSSGTTASLCFQPEVSAIHPLGGLSVLRALFTPCVFTYACISGLERSSPGQTLEEMQLANQTLGEEGSSPSFVPTHIIKLWTVIRFSYGLHACTTRNEW